MYPSENSNNQNEVLIKFLSPSRLKNALQNLANERNITLSALLTCPQKADPLFELGLAKGDRSSPNGSQQKMNLDKSSPKF
jgi:hypothetical protein